MKRKLFIVTLSLFVASNSFAQTRVTSENNYNNWNWNNVLVAQNNYISVAVVPDAAGRMLEYNLGDANSLWVNPKLFGQSFAPNEEVNGTSDWRNFGGYRLVPIPVNTIAIANTNGDKSNRWPPPAMIGDNPYTGTITTNSDGSKAINVISGIQQLPVPKFVNGAYLHPTTIDEELQYERDLHIEDGKSLVFITHTLHNRGTKTVERGLKITSQQISRSQPDLQDGENFLAYIPFDENLKTENGAYFDIRVNPNNRWNFVNRNRMPISRDNPEHVAQFLNSGTNWKGETTPGVYELHYDYNLMGGFHIISSKSWICFVNKTNNTAFAKMFEPYDASKTYEFGLNMEIYNSGLETGYLETEVKTPIYTLAAGENFKYNEIQGAAKIESAPILDVNQTGIITQKLNLTNNNISGKYGVFVAGEAIIKVLNNDHEVLENITINAVNPLTAFNLNQNITINSNANSYQLIIKNSNDQEFILDTFLVNQNLNTYNINPIKNNIDISPNPSNGIITIKGNTSNIKNYNVTDLKGKMIRNVTPFENRTINLSNIKNGTYIVSFETFENHMISKKIILN